MRQSLQGLTRCARQLYPLRFINKKTRLTSLVFYIICGENRIRTCEPVLPVTRFPGVPLQPLEHLSNDIFPQKRLQNYKEKLKRGKMAC